MAYRVALAVTTVPAGVACYAFVGFKLITSYIYTYLPFTLWLDGI